MLYGAELDLGRFAWGYAIFFFAHFSLTFSNDYFDREADSHNTPTPLSGGSGALRGHPELSGLALKISLLLIALSLVTALFFQLTYRPPWYFLPLVLLGGLMGFFYAAPPLRLSYRGLGEISTMVAAGLIMPGMGYLCASGSIGEGFLVLGLVFLAYGAFFILSVEMPDVDGDRAGGKRNLLVRYGLRMGTVTSFLSVLFGSVLLIALSLVRPSDPLDFRALSLFSVLPLLAGIRGLRVDHTDRQKVVGQVKMNFLTLLFFLALIDAYLLFLLG